MLHYNTVSGLLRGTLEKLMAAPEFAVFRLVGGTALSLHRGHRMSVDIDLFTDSDYGSISFDTIHRYLLDNFPYVDTSGTLPVGIGRSYFIGTGPAESVKLDLYYTDKFIDDPVLDGHVRLATVEDIIAMKLDVILRTGRKKDFWDIHELLNDYTASEMLALHKRRYPHTHGRALLISQFTNFEAADHDFEPDCLRGNHWELIRLDIAEWIGRLRE